MKLPSLFRPSSPEQFLGPSQALAHGLARLAAAARASEDAPLRVLLLGPPGTGKTTLATWFARSLGATQAWNWFDCRPVNGKDVDLAFVCACAQSWSLRSFIPGYRILQIEEVDRMTPDAQVRFLTLADQMPKASAIIATSNKALELFEERFQRRFKVLHTSAVPDGEIRQLLVELGSPPPRPRRLPRCAAATWAPPSRMPISP